ncbi:calcium-binding protein [Geminocystis sp. CENA526]|uniref:calcium-binding protein n=1 Tax=Geminocystis sp. CENA526 TaxID=1355871 RepID=UPI003D6FBAC1
MWFYNIERFNIQGTVGGDELYGGSGNDTIIGNNGNDLIESGGGKDILNGGSGIDTLKGGKGNDTYINPTGDRIIELVGEGIDTIESKATFTLNIIALANVENLTLTGTTDINGTGNSLANLITGNDRNNILTGGSGNDTLTGNNGSDQLVGGKGNDVLNLGLNDGVTDTVIYNAGDGTDTVNQFVLGVDKFAVIGLIGVDILTVGSNTQFRLGNGIQGDTGFGTGNLLFTITGVNTFTEANILSSVDASNQATLLFI